MASPKRDLSRQLEAATEQAMRQLSTWLDTRFTEEISAVKWEFPTPPQVRDIVDTGRLRASQTRVVNSDGSVTFTWPVEYAGQVHEGGVSTTGLRFPGRPWTKAPLEEAPAKFGELLRTALEAQQ
jgi:murein tripeptide amidase MpaA